MFLFQKQQLVLFLDKKRLLLLGTSAGEKEELEFTKDEVKEGEVVDKDKFIGSIVSFLAKSSFKKQKVICVLLEDLLHQKTIPFGGKEEIRKEAEEFFKKIHLPEDKRISKTLTDDKNVYLIAANKEFYAFILEAFEDVGWGIKAIVPISVFYKEEDRKKEITHEDASYILDNSKLIEIGNLLVEEDKKESGVKDAGSQKSRSFLLGFVGFIALGIVIGLSLLGVLQFPFGNGGKEQLSKTPTISPTSIPTPTVVVEATPSQELAESAKIEVLNGTGVTGQAAKASGIIKDLGFENIEVDNADTEDASDTIVVFSSQIPEGVRKKVVSELEKTFSKVTSKTSSGSADFDIIITTGKYSLQ